MEPYAGGDRDRVAPITTRVGPALVVTLPRELDDDTLRALGRQALEALQRHGLRALVIEASGLDLLDASEFELLAAVARGAAWIGARTLLVGLSPGVVAYLVDAGVDASAFEPHANLDDALVALGAVTTPSTTQAEPGSDAGGPGADRRGPA